MGRKGKFEKLEKNESYYSVHADEKDGDTARKGFLKKLSEGVKEKSRTIGGIDPEKTPETKKLSSKFTYTKNTRKIIYNETQPGEELAPPDKAPFILTLCVMCLVFAAKLLFSLPSFQELSEKNYAIAEVITSIAAYVVPSLCCLFLTKHTKRLHYIKRFSPKTIPFIAAMFALVLCATALQKYYIAYTFSYSVEFGTAARSLVLVMLTGAVLPAVCEEFFVHGVLQRHLSEYAGGICSVLASALVFAMLHFELQYFLIYFVAGIIMGTLTHVTGSVIPAMIVHFLNNAFSILFSDRLSFIAVERIGGTLLMVVLSLLCFIFLIVSLRIAENILMRKAESKTFSSEDEIVAVAKQGRSLQRCTKVFFGTLMLLCYVLFVAAVIFFSNT